MKKITKKKWINALRSGKYKQGDGSLYRCEDNEKFYCCLGVLCQVTGNSHNRHMVDEFPRFDDDGDVAHFMGLSAYMQNRLSYMNDGNGEQPQSFSQIADYIEKNVKTED